MCAFIAYLEAMIRCLKIRPLPTRLLKNRTAILLALSLLIASISSAENLPQMGEPVDQTLSPAQERQIGQQFMRQARAQLPIIEDNQLNEYIQRLGERLLAGMSGIDHPFTFFLINDNSINAFAVPGGYIAINSGLINSFRNESQVAAVMAHEIAHVTQRHHARAYSAQGNSALTTAATILAAIVLSQHSADASQAALATGIAVGQQSQINYTRGNEYEADRIGIDILSDSGFSASGMAQAFDLLRRASSLNSSGYQLEYLRTHPLGDNRIAEARNRAAQIGNNGDKDSLSFRLFRTRLAILSSKDHGYMRRLLEADKNPNNRIAVDYGLALIDTVNRQYSLALERTSRLVKPSDDNYFVRLLHAELLFLNDKREAAETEFSTLIDLNPTRYSPVRTLSDLLIRTGDLPDAYDILIRYERRNSRVNPDIYRQLANVQQKSGNQTSSHEYLATFYEKNKEPGEAIRQLELALKSADTNSQAELRVSARLKTLRNLKAQRN